MTISVAAVCLNQTPLDWSGNTARVHAALSAAKAASATIVCLPELCLSGYGCEDAFFTPDVVNRSIKALFELLPATAGLITCLGLPLSFEEKLFNTVALIHDGKILGFVAKQFLARDGIHYEPRWFQPWQPDRCATITLNSTQYPIGDLTFDLLEHRIGFEICEDAWVKDRPVHKLAARGVTLILNPSASHFAFGKLEQRKELVVAASKQHKLIYIYSNLLGNEAGRAIYDGGALIARNGEIIAQGPRFSFEDFSLTSTTLTGSIKPAIAAWEQSSELKNEEFTRAEALALFDYMRKSRSRGFVVSLSGGADSSAASMLVGYMLRLGMDQLGLSQFWKRCGFQSAAPADFNAASKQLLCAVYQKTINSSDTTRSAAQKVAAGLNATFIELDVQALVDQYTSSVSQALNLSLNWQEHDIALQNIQARVRSPSVWMIANLKQALLLATSNRSEIALGYATMDGDTSGGLAPLGGIDKAFIRKWLSWCEKIGPHGLTAAPYLAVVTAQAPTAELRPPKSHQTDEDDLMPYTVLDTIERAAVLDKLAPREIYLKLRNTLPQHSGQQIFTWVERFFRLFSQNQWKRERYAPSFHLDAENLDPRSWWRFPILSGCFSQELAELKHEVSAGL